MKPKQKPNVMKILNAYAGSHRHLITLGRILAAVTAFMGLVPFYDLWRIIRNKTVMVIAHRMRTVSGADKIVVLADGVVQESGKPSELMQKGGIFANMVRTQNESQNWVIG